MTKLTPQEEQLMIAIWKVGEGHVKAYMEHMPNPGPYTTVASTIKNLEKKEYISGRLFGNTYVYKPLVSEEEYKKKFMGSVVKTISVTPIRSWLISSWTRKSFPRRS